VFASAPTWSKAHPLETGHVRAHSLADRTGMKYSHLKKLSHLYTRIPSLYYHQPLDLDQMNYNVTSIPQLGADRRSRQQPTSGRQGRRARGAGDRAGGREQPRGGGTWQETEPTGRKKGACGRWWQRVACSP
jgi:hypothetical protein